VILAFLTGSIGGVVFLNEPMDTSIGKETTRWELILAEWNVVRRMERTCQVEFGVHFTQATLLTFSTMAIVGPLRLVGGNDALVDLFKDVAPVYDALKTDDPYSVRDLIALWTEFPGIYLDQILWRYAHTGKDPMEAFYVCTFPSDFIILETPAPMNMAHLEEFLNHPASISLLPGEE